jgi:Kdo2-lipid IVA lauroyltransferase/acyltransferase
VWESLPLGIVRVIPRRFGLRLFRALGFLLYYLMPERRAIAAINLDIAFGETMPPATKRHVAQASFENALALIYDFLKLPQMPPDAFAASIEIQGEEHLKEAFALGRGVLVVSAHFGNFLLLIAVLTARGYPMHVVTRRLKKTCTRNLYIGIMDRFGIGTFTGRRVAPSIMKVLKSGGLVGYVLDRNMSRKIGIFVDFFGKKACTPRGLATMSGRYASPIVPIFIISEPSGKHHIRIGEAFIPPAPKSLHDQEKALTQRYNNLIEEWICRYPHQWVWFHSRWKTRPEGEAPVYPKRSRPLKQLLRRRAVRKAAPEN